MTDAHRQTDVLTEPWRTVVDEFDAAMWETTKAMLRALAWHRWRERRSTPQASSQATPTPPARGAA